MKKNIFRYTLLAMMTTAFVSCSKDSITDINKGNAIGFRVATTRASELTLSGLSEFNVTALNADTQAPYFTDLEFTPADGNRFEAATNYYWPQYNLDFYAYAPTTLNVTAPFELEYTPNAVIKSQEDIVAAYALGSKADNENNGVAINFKHLLTRIDINASNINDGYEYKVLGAKIANVASSGTVTYQKAQTIGSGEEAITLPAHWKWEAGITPTSYEVPQYTECIDLTDEPKSLMSDQGSAMLIPQDFIALSANNAEGTYIGLLVNIKTKDTGVAIYPTDDTDEEAITVKDGVNYAWIAVPISGSWEVGKYYTYNIEFNELDKLVSPDPDNVESIVGGAISIDVDVDNWGGYSEYNASTQGVTTVPSEQQ